MPESENSPDQSILRIFGKGDIVVTKLETNTLNNNKYPVPNEHQLNNLGFKIQVWLCKCCRSHHSYTMLVSPCWAPKMLIKIIGSETFIRIN